MSVFTLFLTAFLLILSLIFADKHDNFSKSRQSLPSKSKFRPSKIFFTPSSNCKDRDSRFGNEFPNADSCGIRSCFELANLIDLSKSFNKQLNKEKQLNQQLKTENQQLTAQNQQLTIQNQQLITENQQLTTQNQLLTAQNQQLTTQNQSLTAQNQLLTTENQQLIQELVYINNNVLSLPLTFQSTTLTYSFTNFGGGSTQVITNPYPSGINVSTKVARFLKTSGAETYAGSFLDLGYPIDFSTKKIIKMKVYSPQVGAIVKIIFENIGNTYNIAVDSVTTIANTWEELSFDFSAINTANSFQRIVFFFDFGNAGLGTTYYFDDMIQSLS